MDPIKQKNGTSSKLPEISGLRTWIEIDKGKIKHNYGVFRSLLHPSTKLMSVVKSNAYGHGLIDFSKEVSSFGVDWLGVDSVVEAVALRENGLNKPILVLGYVMPERVDEVGKYGISISVSSSEQLETLIKTGKTLSIHLKVDTGMHRQGFLPHEKEYVLGRLKTQNSLKLEGLFTHFAAAKNPAFPEYTKMQIAEFEKWRNFLKEKGFEFLSHAAATSGTLLFPEAHFDMVRIGIGMYGMWPSNETEEALKERIELKPVLVWKTIVSEFKKLPEGSKIGYDGTEILHKNSVVAVCPIGYWHGFARSLSSVGRVLVNGVEARVLGRVSMDMICVDVTNVQKLNVGDHVTLIGGDGGLVASAKQMASLSDTSYYETVTRLNPLVRRIYK